MIAQTCIQEYTGCFHHFKWTQASVYRLTTFQISSSTFSSYTQLLPKSDKRYTQTTSFLHRCPHVCCCYTITCTHTHICDQCLCRSAFSLSISLVFLTNSIICAFSTLLRACAPPSPPPVSQLNSFYVTSLSSLLNHVVTHSLIIYFLHTHE